MTALLVAEDLTIDYITPRGTVRALDGATLTLEPGTSLGLVGESGSGKTTLGMAIGRLLPSYARRVGGDLSIDGRSVFALDNDGITTLRRDRLGFVFQSPMAALDPTMRIGRQVSFSLGDRARGDDVFTLLRKVGLADVEHVARAYPHELSGGMAQRVVIAMAIARRPSLIVADEPTASLDASIRDQILDLLMALKEEAGAAFILLSHEMSVVARYCDMIAVMYGGRVVEHGPSADVLNQPTHPYTRALLEAAPGKERAGQRLSPIPGVPPVLSGPSAGCSFAPRCRWAEDLCHRTRPMARDVARRITVCHRAEAVAEACDDNAFAEN